MTITDVTLYSYRIPVNGVIKLKTAELRQREGLLLQVKDDRGNSGWGDICPLPGFSDETLEQAVDQAVKLKRKLLASPFTGHVEKLHNGFEDWFNGAASASSVRFGVESAVLTLKAAVKHQPVARLLRPDHETAVTVNGLISSDIEDVESEALRLVGQGYRSIKLKIGTRSLEDDIQRVTVVSRAIESRAILRLDANRAWTLEQAKTFGTAIGLNTVEYIEEPLADPAGIPEFYRETLIPVALDETAREMDFAAIKAMEGVDVLILKPTLNGGVEKTWHLAEQARAMGIRVVITSVYESPVGLYLLANLAACLSRHVPVGLDTARRFGAELIPGDPARRDTQIFIDRTPIRPDQLDRHLLTPLDP